MFNLRSLASSSSFSRFSSTPTISRSFPRSITFSLPRPPTAARLQFHSSNNSSFNSSTLFRTLLSVSVASLAGYSISYLFDPSRPSISLPIKFSNFPTEFNEKNSNSNRPSPQKNSSNSSNLPGPLQFLDSLSTPIKCILFSHIIIFLLHRIPKFDSFMEKHFTCTVDGIFRSKRYYTLLTSVFSHRTPIHLLLNSYCLVTFSGSVTQVLNDKQFLALYGISGILSSITSHLSVLWASKGANQISYRYIPQLGASGAICAVVALSACLNPDMKIGIILLPFQFEAINFMKGMAIFEICGMIYTRYVGLTGLGHGAHFGGILCGFAAFEYFIRISPKVQKYYQYKKYQKMLRFQ